MERMTHFRLSTTFDGRPMVEVWQGDEFIGAVYPAERGMHIVSKHPITTQRMEGEPALIEVKFGKEEGI